MTIQITFFANVFHSSGIQKKTANTVLQHALHQQLTLDHAELPFIIVSYLCHSTITKAQSSFQSTTSINFDAQHTKESTYNVTASDGQLKTVLKRDNVIQFQ